MTGQSRLKLDNHLYSLFFVIVAMCRIFVVRAAETN